MIGVIAGDVIGSVHEHARTKSTDFPLFAPRSGFTDDTVLTVAGGSFYEWLMAGEPRPYGSWGNGSAMVGCVMSAVRARSDNRIP